MLATLHDLEAYLGLTSGNADDALLADLLDRASGVVDQVCNRHLSLGTYTETRNGTGGSYLALREAPVIAVTSLSLSGLALGPIDFTHDDYGIYLTRGFFPRGPQTIAVTYQAGYATIPAEVQHAAIKIAALFYRCRARLGETSRSIGGGHHGFYRRRYTSRRSRHSGKLQAGGADMSAFEMIVTGDKAVVARFETLSQRIKANLARAIGRLLVTMVSAVRAKLNGPVLKRVSGRLQASITKQLIVSDLEVTGIIGAGKSIPYAAIHEFGGTTSPHIITARKAKALAFQAGGETIFRKSVHHPGSKIPERSYLRSTLADFSDRIRTALAKAASDEATP